MMESNKESNKDFCLRCMETALNALRDNAPKERSSQARSWAVTITELEKAIAYFKTYVGDE